MNNKLENELILKPFQSTVIIDFGNIIIGRSEIKFLYLTNDLHLDQYIKIIKFPGSGFSLNFYECTIAANSSLKIEITWSPIVTGNAHEIITFKAEGVPLQVKLIGSSVEPKAAKKTVKRPANFQQQFKVKSENKENIFQKPIIKLAMQTDGNITSSRIKANPSNYSANPFIYDDTWLKNQETSFVMWLNHIFSSNQSQTKIEDIVNNKDKFKEKAKNLFKQPHIITAIKKIDTEISKDTVSLKSELRFRQNSVDHNQLTDLIMNYNSLWLLLALEVMFDQEINISLNSTSADIALRKLIANKILWCPNLAKKHDMKSTSLRTTEKFDHEHFRYILKRFFSLVYFLDEAKRMNIFPVDVNLFRKNSNTKSSSEMITKFTSKYIKGEGGILRRLNNWGCFISHEQSVLDDYDFTVSNLSEDISDGVRLVKLAKILVGVDVMHLIRFPAIDLTRKIFNINLAINSFKEAGSQIVSYSGEEIDTSQIPWGHREKTLALLWCILSRHHIDSVIDREKLIREMKRLGKIVQQTISGQELLLTWVQIVCGIYNINVKDLSNFNDGRVLCILVHHYLPETLKLSEINHNTTSMSIIDDINTHEILLENEKENFRLFFKKLKEIGGAPIMLLDDQIPSQELIITTLAFFSSRLIDLMDLFRAATCIQRAWRKYRSHFKCLAHYIKYERKVIVVQSCARRYLASKDFKSQQKKIVTCQTTIKCYLAVKNLKKKKQSAICIQKIYRGFIVRQKYMKMKEAIIILQANFRKCIAQKQYFLTFRSTITIQKYVRGYLCRLKYAAMLRSAVIIQRYTRGYIIRKKYETSIKAVITIQTTVRCYLARKAYTKKIKSIIILQSCVRKYLMQKKFITLMKSVIIIQKTVRTFLIKIKYQKMLASSITIQKYCRGFFARQKYIKMKSAVAVFERYFHIYLERKRFLLKKSAAITIQKYFRSFIHKNRFSIIKQSAIVIQKYIRRFLCRRQFSRNFQSIIFLQSMIKMYVSRKQYQLKLKAVLAIQNAARGYWIRRRYLAVKKATILIQKNVRRFICLKKFVLMKQSVIVIQKYVRRFICRKGFALIKQSVLVIQKYARGFIIRVAYKKQLCTIIIQKNIRGYLARRQIRFNHQAATVIQKNYRSYILRTGFEKKKASAILIQKYFRSFMHKNRFRIIIRSAIIIQKHIRGFLCRHQYFRDIQSVVMLQSKIRMYLTRKQYQQKLKAVLTIQNTFRGYFIKKKYLIVKQATLIIQKNMRSFICSKKFKLIKQSVIVMQKYTRGFIARAAYKKQLSAIIIQKNFRGYLTKKQIIINHKAAAIIQKNYRSYVLRTGFWKKKTAAITIQKYFRGFYTRKQYVLKREKIILIQSYVRMLMQIKKYTTLRSAIVCMQKFVKGFSARRRYLKQKEAAISIQRYFRRYICKNIIIKKFQVAVIIQKYARGYIKRQKYIQQRSAAVCIQKYYRKMTQRTKFLNMKKNVTVIQKYTRRLLVKKQLNILQRSALIIQKNFRSYLAKKEYIHKKQCCIQIQSQIRGYLCLIKYRIIRKAVILIQKNTRVLIAILSYKRTVNATVIIQKNVRKYLAVKRFFNMKKSAILIQTNVRQYLARKKYTAIKNSAIILQKTIRRYLAQKSFTEVKNSVITIQRFIRGYIARNKCQRKLSAIVAIQSFVRRNQAKKRYNNVRNAVIMIQKNMRSYLARVEYKKKNNAVLNLQRLIKGLLVRRRFLQLKKASTVILKYTRGYLTRQHFLENRESMLLAKITLNKKRERAATIIQSIYRGYTEKKYYLALYKSVLVVQIKWRIIYKNRIKVASIFQKYLLERKRELAAVNIQRIWRGNKVRNEMMYIEIGPEISQIRSRFIEAQKRYSEIFTIRYIGVKALEDLKKPNCTVARILSCLASLEKVTSLSREICKWLIDSNAYDILLDLIHDCNRGVADLEVVSKSISVLFNLGKAEVLNLEIIGSEVGVFLKDLLVRNINAKRGTKGVTIFCHTCLLLVLLINMEQKSNTVYQYSICNDVFIKTSIYELKQILQNRVTNNLDNYFSSDKILEQMRLNPWWDLKRKKPFDHTHMLIFKKGSTASLQEMKTSRHVNLIDGAFKKPQNLPIVCKPVRKIALAPPISHINRSTSFSNNLQRINSSEHNFEEMHKKHKSNANTEKLKNLPNLPVVSRPSSKPVQFQPISNLSRSTSFSNNLQKSISTEINKRSPNIWDITHQLYAINLLWKTLDV